MEDVQADLVSVWNKFNAELRQLEDREIIDCWVEKSNLSVHISQETNIKKGDVKIVKQHDGKIKEYIAENFFIALDRLNNFLDEENRKRGNIIVAEFLCNDKKFIEIYKNGSSLVEIARILGCSASDVQRRASRLIKKGINDR